MSIFQSIKAALRTSDPATIYFGKEVQIKARQSDGTPTFSTMAYSGGPLRIANHNVPVILDVITAEFERHTTKVNRDHDHDKPIGHTTRQLFHRGPEKFGIEFDGELSYPSTHTDEVVKAAKNDFPWDCSIEAEYDKNQATHVEAGQQITVNGKTWKGPVIVARYAKVNGLAILNTGADRQATVSIAAELSRDEFDGLTAPKKAEPTPTQKKIKALIASGLTHTQLAEQVSKDVAYVQSVEAGRIVPTEAFVLDVQAVPILAQAASSTPKEEDMSADMKAFLKSQGVETLEQLQAKLGGAPPAAPASAPAATPVAAAAPATPVPAATPVAPTQPAPAETTLTVDIAAAKQQMKDELKAGRAEELHRQSAIETIGAKYEGAQTNIGTEEAPNLVNLVAHAIENDWTPAETRMAAMTWELEKRSAGASPAIHDATNYDQSPDVIKASLLLTSGMSEAKITKHKLFPDNVMQEALTARFKNFRPSQLAYGVIKAAGLHVRPGQLDREYYDQLMMAERRNMVKLHASGFTTNSFQSITKDVANKILMVAYSERASIIPFVFGPITHTNFKPMYSYRISSSGVLEQVGKDGEIKHGQLLENEYTQKLSTYAKMLTWTRQDIIDDDIGVLNSTISELGRMAFRAMESGAIKTITDPTLWDPAQNENVEMTVYTNEFSIGGLTASTVDFEGRTDADGFPVNIEASNVLLPSALSVIGDSLQNDTEIREDGNAAARIYTTKNPHAGKFNQRSTPWLDNEKANPNDAARASSWYRFSDPNGQPALCVGSLNGQMTPMVESAETDFNTLGQQYRAVHDWSFGRTDPRFRQRNVVAAAP